MYSMVVGNINTIMNKEPLPQERYDRKLFKQAIKAAKEAKELEKKIQKKDRLKKSTLSFLIIVILCVTVYLLLPLFTPKSEYISAQPYPLKTQYNKIEGEDISFLIDREISVPNISAQSAIAYNPINGDILYEKNIYEKKSIASLTKLLTAIIVLENFDLDQVINVSLENIPEDLDWQLKLSQGDKISVESLLKAMLISSYNDSAYIIANAYPYGGYEGFIKAMNRKAKILKMNSSSFSNPAGIDEELNYSTVMDVAILTSVARKYDEILNIVGLSKDVINWSTQERLISKELETTNDLNGSNKYLRGLKTGITDLAGQCFVGYYVYPNGNQLVTIVIDSKDRFGETIQLEKYARNVLK